MTLLVERAPSPEMIGARPAGFFHDLASIAGRALRAVPRDLAVVMPPVFISLFFFIVNVATLKKVVDHIPGLNYTAFQMGTAILLGVTGVSRAPALVLDIQNRYFDRLLLSPGTAYRDPRGPHVGRRSCGRGPDRANHRARTHTWCPLQQRPTRGRRLHPARRTVELGLCRVRVRHRPQNGEPVGGELDVPPLFPVPFSHLGLRAPGPAFGMAQLCSRRQSGYLSPRGLAIARSPIGMAVD